MNRYIAQEVLTIGQGIVLYFTDAQAANRGHRIESLGGDKYRAMEILQIKKGEEFGMDGELPKSQAQLVNPVQYSADVCGALTDAGMKIDSVAKQRGQFPPRRPPPSNWRK